MDSSTHCTSIATSYRSYSYINFTSP